MAGLSRTLRRERLFFILMISFALSGPVRLYADDTSSTGAAGTAADAVPSSQTVYTVALGSISDKGLSAAERGFPPALLQLISQRLPALLPPRLPDGSYEAEMASLSSLTSLYSAGTELATKLDSLALVCLQPGIIAEKRDQNRESAEAEVEKAHKKLEDLKTDGGKTGQDSTSAENAVARDPRKTSLYDGNLKGDFIEAGKAGPAAAISGKNISLLIYGEAEDSGGYVALTLYGYDSGIGRNVFSWRDYSAASDPEPLASELAARIAAWVGGEDYARIAIDLSPSRAYLLVNGRVLEQDERTLYLSGYGSITIEAASPGSEAKALRLDYGPGDRKHVGLILGSVPMGDVFISADPADASLALNGMPLGKAPLTAGLTGERAVVTASAPGYESATAIVPASGGGSLELKLRPDDGIGPEGRLNKARDSFYWSLGFLILSIPVATISYAVTYGYSAAAAAAYGSSYYNAIYNSWKTAYYVYGGSLALVTGTAINAGIHLYFYIKSTQ